MQEIFLSEGRGGYNRNNKREYDEELLLQIQNYFDSGHSVRDVAKKFSIGFGTLKKLHELGKLNLERSDEERTRIRNIKRKDFKLSPEARKKISDSLRKTIAENPDKSPYLRVHHSHGESKAEAYFRKWLEKEKIPFRQEYRFDTYAFDFLVNDCIDLEIDGSQHKNDKRIANHDIIRDKNTRDAGFIVYRIYWPDYQRLPKEKRVKFLSDLKDFLLDDTIPTPHYVIEKDNTPEKQKRGPNQKTLEKVEAAYEMYANNPNAKIKDIAAVFGVSTRSIVEWIKSYPNISDEVLKRLELNQRHFSDATARTKVSEEDKIKALELLKAGNSYRGVGKMFGVSDNTIRKWIKSLGENPAEYANIRKM